VADLFELTDLAAYMQQDLDTATATTARRIASGWLGSATGLSTDWTDPVPDELWAWGLELAEMAYGNPGGYASEGIDDHSVSFNKARRAEILAAAKSKYSTGSTPVYSFPEPDWSWTTVTTTTLTD
jgi:hypothetical protein